MNPYQQLTNPFVKLCMTRTMLVLCAIILPLMSTPQAHAISGIQASQFPFYDPDYSSSCANPNEVGAVGQIPADIQAGIDANKDIYLKAQQVTGVPWQMLAAIHYREASFSTSRDIQAGNPFGGPYSRTSTSYAQYGYPKDIQESVIIAAKVLIDMAKGGVVKKPINVANPPAEAVKDTFFSYNGRAQAYANQAATLGFDPVKQPYEGSPYVMNNYDDKHKDMKIITRDGGPVDSVDSRYGAFTIYAFLGGGIGSGACGDSSDVQASGDLFKTIVLYAWPTYHAAPYRTMKPEYKAAVDAARKNGEYIGGISYPGVDCGGFVTRVMRNSKVDPKYNSSEGATGAQLAYLKSHPELYKKINGVRGTGDLQPGDIAIRDGHTYFFVGGIPGFKGNSASASLDERSPMASSAYDFGGFEWYRHV